MVYNMLSHQELRLLELFRRDVLASFSILQLMRRTKSRSYSAVFKAARSLIKGGVLLSEVRGHSRICWLNLGSQCAIKHLALLDYAEAAARNVPHIDEISGAVPTHTIRLLWPAAMLQGRRERARISTWS